MAIERAHFEMIDAWSRAGVAAVLVRVAAVKGSTPRDADAVMAVTASATVGTIGGGRLEWLAMARARAILAGAEAPGELEVALGPEIGQCCGGRVRLSFATLDAALLASLQNQARDGAGRLPHVLVFGAGHTGRALATALAPLPLMTRLIDTRADAYEGYTAPVEAVVTPLPEAEVRAAPPGGAFVTMTHDHALDFLIAAEALRRGDAAYVGMIGSATKRAVFLSWLDESGPEGGYGRELGGRLVCPIGGARVRDKRPAVIAALTAAEILEAVAAYSPVAVP